jgi:hypothetical protein
MKIELAEDGFFFCGGGEFSPPPVLPSVNAGVGTHIALK